MAFTFEQTKSGYAALWDRAILKAQFANVAMNTARRIIALRSYFIPVQDATGVPWWMIGCMLFRESDLNVHTYLGNGQSLNRRTTEVPAGRGPFPDFASGAIDAIELEGMQGIAWTLE